MIAVERIGAGNAVAACAPAVVGGELDAGQRDDEGDIGQAVEGEGEGDAALGDDDRPGDRRADEARDVEDERIDRHRRGQVGAVDQVRDERQARRLVDRVDDAEDAA